MNTSNTNVIRIKIGKEIKQIRTTLNLTQPQFVKEFNDTDPTELVISQQDLSRYERAQVCIPGDKLEKIRSLNTSCV